MTVADERRPRLAPGMLGGLGHAHAHALALALALLLCTACGGSPPPTDAAPRPLEVSIEEITSVSEADRLREEEKRLLAVGIAERREGRHGALPEMEQHEEDNPDAWPIVRVKNDTPHGLVVWFAGPCPRTVALVPGGEHIAELCEGDYDIAAELTADDFLPFVGDGDELANGYAYSLSFYVVAEPRVRTRRVRRR